MLTLNLILIVFFFGALFFPIFLQEFRLGRDKYRSVDKVRTPEGLILAYLTAHAGRARAVPKLPGIRVIMSDVIFDADSKSAICFLIG